MKRQIRRGTFETNSSSLHAMTMCAKSDYDKWVNGEMAYDYWEEELVEITPDIKKSMDEDERHYLTYDQFNDYDYIEYETFEESFTTESNETVVSFGYYGHD